MPAKSKKRKMVDEDEGTKREQAAGAKRRSRGEERGHTTSEQGNKKTEKRSEHSSRSRPGAGMPTHCFMCGPMCSCGGLKQADAR